MYDPELAVANKALDQARRELAALRSAIADVLEMATGFDDPHDFRECAVERLRLASLPPIAKPNEGE